MWGEAICISVPHSKFRVLVPLAYPVIYAHACIPVSSAPSCDTADIRLNMLIAGDGLAFSVACYMLVLCCLAAVVCSVRLMNFCHVN